ncbi:MAG: PEP-CTERM sorting domain-containing protein, partial [Planctomycetes bacterium]|nr:PEP-CTERM sorting domain-containing protein [Planctomycetota bacterium]
ALDVIGYDPAYVFLIPGDLDLDGDVDIFDFAIFQINYGTQEGMGPRDGDLDGDNGVDIFDFAIFQTYYKNNPSGGVPEPGSLGLLVIGALAALRRRRPGTLAARRAEWA